MSLVLVAATPTLAAARITADAPAPDAASASAAVAPGPGTASASGAAVASAVGAAVGSGVGSGRYANLQRAPFRSRVTFVPVSLDRKGASRGLAEWQSPRQGLAGAVARLAFGATQSAAAQTDRIAEAARIAEVARVAEEARLAEAAAAAVAAEEAQVAEAAQAAAEAEAAASAAAQAAPSYTKYVWTSGWQSEIDSCQGAVDLSGNYGVAVIAEHWSCGGSHFPADGTIIALTGVRSGTYRVGAVVAILNANTERTDAIPRGYDLLYQTCINGSNATMSFTELTRVG